MFIVLLHSYTSPDFYTAVASPKVEELLSQHGREECVRNMDYSWDLCSVPGAAMIAVDWDHL